MGPEYLPLICAYSHLMHFLQQSAMSHCESSHNLSQGCLSAVANVVELFKTAHGGHRRYGDGGQRLCALAVEQPGMLLTSWSPSPTRW